MPQRLFQTTVVNQYDQKERSALAALGLRTAADVLSFSPAIDAQMVQAANDGHLHPDDARVLLNAKSRRLSLEKVLASPVKALQSVDARTADILARIGIFSISDLAAWDIFLDAEEGLTEELESTLEEDPVAPDCVLPRCRKFVRDAKSFTSFFRAVDIGDLKIEAPASGNTLARLFNGDGHACGSLYLGYASTYRQDWISSGIHLGEPLGSVSLMMGQDSQLSRLDWKRANRAMRGEDSRVSEQLVNLVVHQRAVDEVARATAEEHQYGATSSVGANAATSGSFVAAGAIVGGVGGGVSGALAGLVIGNAANAAGGAPTLAGAAVGTAVGSVAGAAAGALVFSGATTLGFVETEANGERSIVGDSGQRIQERAMQNASSIRSFWSNIVTQSVEDEQQRLNTERVTNYNQIHALNGIYFEVLNRYRVNLWLTSIQPLVYLPFRPFQFDLQILQQYWWILREYMKDADLVAAIDSHFLSLAPIDSALEAVENLPTVDEIEATWIEVELDFDGSWLSAAIGQGIDELGGDGSSFAAEAIAAVIAVAAGFLGGMTLLVKRMVKAVYDTIKRESIRVSLETTGADIPLFRGDSANLNPEFVGKYQTNRNIRISTITGIRIDNENSNLTIGIPRTDLSIDLSAVAFEGVKVDLRLRNRQTLLNAVPALGDLEDAADIGSPPIQVSGNGDKTISWPIASTLTNRYAGITAQQDALAAATNTAETVATRIDRLLGFLNANKFGFTRLILQQVEREQLACLLDQLCVGGVDLRSFAGTTPVGFSGGHILLPLKKVPNLADPQPLTFAGDTRKIKTFLDNLLAGLQGSSLDLKLVQQLTAELDAYILQLQSEFRNREPERGLRERLAALRDFQTLLTAQSPTRGGISRLTEQVIAHIQATLAYIKSPGLAPPSTTPATSGLDLIRGYYDIIAKDEEALKADKISSDEVSLPTPAVFMEPVLSNAKGAELYDILRNTHYDIRHAPEILPADPNVNRSAPQDLTPTVPAAVLEQTQMPAYALPNTLATFGTEAGRLNLSTMLQTNAASLATTLDNLSALATEMAKASSTLAGDAQKDALATAGKLGEQIGSIIEGSLSDMAKLADSMGTTPPSEAPKPPDPGRPTGEALVEEERTEKKKISKKRKERRKRTMGMPKTTPDPQDYAFQFIFRDENGAPYDFGTAEITATMFRYNQVVAFNGGIPIEMTGGTITLPLKDRITMTPGDKITLQTKTVFEPLDPMTQTKVIIVSRDRNIIFDATMKSKTMEITESSVKKAVDKVVESTVTGITAQAALKAKLEQIAKAGLELPFKVMGIGVAADGSLESSGTLDGSTNLSGEYTTSTETTDGDDTSTTTTKKYTVTIPLFAWKTTIK